MKITVLNLENWREIGATLARNKTRTFLTAFGIFWGTAMLALLWGGANGFQGIMSRNFAGLSTNMGVFSAGTRSISYRGFNKGSAWTLTQGDVDAIRQVAPAIEYSSTVNNCRATAVVGDKSTSAMVIGVEAQYALINTPVIYSGRFINASDVASGRKVAVIGRNVAAELYPGGDPVGQDVNLNGVHFTVIGVEGQLGEASIGGRLDDNFIVPSTTLRRAFNQGDLVYFFMYTAPAGSSPADNEAAIRRVISSRHTIHPDDTGAVDFQDISETFQMIDNIFLGVTILAFFVGFGSLMAGVIGVGNIMWIVVKERTHEFGVRRAIGAKPADITAQVLCESVLLTVVAGTAGVCFAALILGVMDMATADPNLPAAGFQISFGRAIGIVLAFIVLGSAAGTLPAIKAMKIKPIEALRSK